MTIYNLGSINIDHVLRVPHLPAPGETLTASACDQGLGGKGANHSMAAARAGAEVIHLGAVGQDGGPWLDQLAAAGVDVSHVARLSGSTGRADIRVDDAGENSIVVFPGANAQIPEAAITAALKAAKPSDLLLLQNETNGQALAAKAAQAHGMKVIYSAAPFLADVTLALLPYISVLIVNEIEAAQLSAALGRALTSQDVPVLVITRGAAGASWCDLAAGRDITRPSPKVSAVDTTGAGDCFSGYLAAGLDQGLGPEAAMEQAVAAAALSVTRPGAASAVPMRDEVTEFMKSLP